MNSTKWESLSGFVQYLSTSGKVLVDESEKGLYITWIDRDPEVLARQERLAKKEKAAQDDTALMEKLMRKRAALARSEAASSGVSIEQAAATGMRKGAADVAFRVDSVGGGAASSARVGGAKSGKDKTRRRQAMNFNDRTGSVSDAAAAAAAAATAPPSKRARITFTEGAGASASAHGGAASAAASAAVASAAATGGRPRCWLCESLVVKCKNKIVGDGKYFKKKARVLRVNDDGGAGDMNVVTADVRMMDTGDKLRVDQSDLETVVPKPRMAGGRSRVMLLSGAQRGMTGTLVALHLDRFCADVELDDGTGRVATGVEYEDLCKMAVLSVEEEKKAMKERRKKEKKEKKKKKKKKKKKEER
jgi:DNA/RNA-binding protein KIN17